MAWSLPIRALPVTKASVELKGTPELGVDGRNYGFTYYDYTFFVTPQNEDACGVKFLMYITGPLDVYYRYLPISEGAYTVFRDYFPLPARAIPVNEDVNDSADFTFFGSQGNETFYAVTDGSIEITDSEMENEVCTVGFSGRLRAVNYDDPQDIIEFDVAYFHSMVYWDGYYYSWTCHPFSTATADISAHDFTAAVYEDKGYGRWSEEGGPADVAYTQIMLIPEGGVFEEWNDPDEANPDNYYLSIGLHLARTVGETGGIPAGTYKMDKDWKFTPGTLMPGSILVVSNRPYGLHYYNGNMEDQAPARATIRRSGTNDR